jgi:homocysteine S-methyltransferase
MPVQSPLPSAGSGEVFLTEGGSETEIMYRHGFELAEFAMFPLLDKPKALAAIRAMYCAQLDVAAEYGLSFLLTGLSRQPGLGGQAGLFTAVTGRRQYCRDRVSARHR